MKFAPKILVLALLMSINLHLSAIIQICKPTLEAYNGDSVTDWYDKPSCKSIAKYQDLVSDPNSQIHPFQEYQKIINILNFNVHWVKVFHTKFSLNKVVDKIQNTYHEELEVCVSKLTSSSKNNKENYIVLFHNSGPNKDATQGKLGESVFQMIYKGGVFNCGDDYSSKKMVDWHVQAYLKGWNYQNTLLASSPVGFYHSNGPKNTRLKDVVQAFFDFAYKYPDYDLLFDMCQTFTEAFFNTLKDSRIKPVVSSNLHPLTHKECSVKQYVNERFNNVVYYKQLKGNEPKPKISDEQVKIEEANAKRKLKNYMRSNTDRK